MATILLANELVKVYDEETVRGMVSSLYGIIVVWYHRSKPCRRVWFCRACSMELNDRILPISLLVLLTQQPFYTILCSILYHIPYYIPLKPYYAPCHTTPFQLSTTSDTLGLWCSL